jgi:hypothetical protein
VTERISLDLGEGRSVAFEVAGIAPGYDASLRSTMAAPFDLLADTARAMVDKLAIVFDSLRGADELTIAFSLGMSIEPGGLVAAVVSGSAEAGVSIEMKWLKSPEA